MFNIKINKHYDEVIFISILILTILVTVSLNIVLGIELVYTHLFYIPIILAGILYHKKAVYVAIFLGMAHIIANYSLYHAFTYSPFLRTAIFILIAYTIGTIAEKKDEIVNKLKSSEDYLRVLFNVLEQSPNSILIADTEGKITYLNPRCSLAIGHSPEEVLGKNTNEVFRDYPYYPVDITQPSQHKVYESQITDRDGKLRWLYSGVSPIRNDRGEVTHRVQIDVDITQNKMAEIALRNSEERYRQLITLAQEGILTVNGDFQVTFANPYLVSMLGYSREEIMNKPLFDFIDDLSKDGLTGLIKNSEMIETPEYVILIAKDGARIYASAKVSQISDGNSNGSTLILMADLTDRIKRQEVLNASLVEKDVLLKEIHHRVKNNLQIISSLVNLQSEKIMDADDVNALSETQARIRTMALIHEKMYRSIDLSNINLAEYISNLTKALFSIYNTNRSRIRLNLKLDTSIQIDMDTAVPCGLIINELVSNCLKHAFPGERQGEVTIELTRNENKVFVRVSDNGIGFPPGLDYKNTETLGMQLVYTLIDQLEGTINLHSGNGTTFIMEFPLSEQKVE